MAIILSSQTSGWIDSWVLETPQVTTLQPFPDHYKPATGFVEYAPLVQYTVGDALGVKE